MIKFQHQGKVFKFGDNVDIEHICATHLHAKIDQPEALAQHCMTGLDPDFPKKAKPGDLIVGGRNFGCGPIHVHAVLALKAVGIAAVIAETFSRSFYRCSISSGLPLIECERISEHVADGDLLAYNLHEGYLRNITKEKELKFHPLPEFMLSILKMDGMKNFLLEQLKARGRLSE